MPHTPGPWETTRYGSIHAGQLVEFTQGFGRDQIAMVCGRTNAAPDVDPLEERDSNARLIAAAPELLEALKTVEIIECWECRGSGDHCTGDGKPCPDCDGTGLLVADGDPKAIKQAIAKAEGPHDAI